MHAAERDPNSCVGVIGLGLMGTALAERFLEHGYRVKVWNRTRSKADPLLARGAEWSDHPLAGCSRVVVSLFTTENVIEVLEQMRADRREGLGGFDNSAITEILRCGSPDSRS